jgi:hypothetical protein
VNVANDLKLKGFPDDEESALHRNENSKTIVVVGFAEAISAPEVVWSLVDEGFQVTAFARRGRRCALHHSRYIVCHEITPPELDLQASLSDLRGLLVSLNAGINCSQRILFPMDDAAVWLCSKVSREPDWKLAGPSDENADLALDKYVQIQAAINAGFNVPRTRIVTNPSDILGGEQCFPLILKPRKSVSIHKNSLHKGSSWICGSQEELERAVAKWTNRVPLLAQPFISGTGEGIFGLATPEGIRMWSAHRRLRMMNPHGSGSSACIAQAVHEELKPPVERLIGKARWLGLFMIELLRDPSGTVWFMELNGRPWGSMALARKQGLEYPAWNVKLAIDAQSSFATEQPGKAGLVCRHLGREFMYPLFVLRGPKSKALSTWPSFWKAIGDIIRVRRGDRLYNWRKDDLKVFISDCCYTLRDQIFKGKR